MARKRHNSVLILGVLFLLIGTGLFFAGGRSASFHRGRANAFTSDDDGTKVLIIRDGDGEIAGQIYAPSGREQINHNAADDPAFQGLEGGPKEGSFGDFLGLYDFNIMTAFTIIFMSAGGILVLISSIKTSPKKRYY